VDQAKLGRLPNAGGGFGSDLTFDHRDATWWQHSRVLIPSSLGL